MDRSKGIEWLSIIVKIGFLYFAIACMLPMPWRVIFSAAVTVFAVLGFVYMAWRAHRLAKADETGDVAEADETAENDH
jgi:hypothetical protein